MARKEDGTGDDEQTSDERRAWKGSQVEVGFGSAGEQVRLTLAGWDRGRKQGWLGYRRRSMQRTLFSRLRRDREQRLRCECECEMGRSEASAGHGDRITSEQRRRGPELGWVAFGDADWDAMVGTRSTYPIVDGSR